MSKLTELQSLLRNALAVLTEARSESKPVFRNPSWPTEEQLADSLAIMRRMRLAGEGLQDIADTLNAKRHKAPRGGIWYPSTINTYLGRHGKR